MKRLPETKLKIVIVDDRANKACGGSCGLDWSSAVSLDTVRQQVRDKFGDNIDISYIDLSKTVDNEDLQAMNGLVGGVSMPVLLVNDRPRIIGDFDSRQLMDVIEIELEMGMV